MNKSCRVQRLALYDKLDLDLPQYQVEGIRRLGRQVYSLG